MARLDFITALHTQTRRDYRERVAVHDKAECARVAKRFDADYWDGARRFGYGGFRDDGRWQGVARRIANHYGLHAGQAVLDIGCGKAFLLNELATAVPGLVVRGLDISRYAIEHAPEHVREFLDEGTATNLPYSDSSFDLVLSINTLHNLGIRDLETAFREIRRVGRGAAFIVVESWRDEREKANLLAWQLTCESLFSVDGWEWIFERFGYTGDHEFIFFAGDAPDSENGS
ncbi:MAG: class I SAM-dependent methyltransferase [Deltaproteobacteria bacterium]|nr:class I SAM-dependent methyltransferase [Deltaproteobacteria bacterium]